MAEVLSPSMQPANNITLLHSRPSSSDAFQASPAQFQQAPRLGQQPRGMYNAQNNGHRATAAPVQPYAFQATPNLRQDGRPASGPNASPQGRATGHRHGHSQSTSTTTSSSDVSSQPSAKDDSVIGSRNGSLINISANVPDLSLSTFDEPTKPSPGRYHRPAQKRTDSPGTVSKASGPTSTPTAGTTPTTASTPTAVSGVAEVAQRDPAASNSESVDDIAVPRTSNAELAKRYRRRSLNALDTQHLPVGPGAQRPASSHGATSTPTSIRPPSLHSRGPSEGGASPAQRKDGKENMTSGPVLRADQKGVTVPPRGSSDVNKRINHPSPLSKQAVEADNRPSSSAGKPRTYAAVAQAGVQSDSPAVQHLAAVSDKDLNKGMKSRLRRAFSFGSAQELRRGAAENSNAATNAQQVREQHQQRIDDELDPEQQEIARRQEEAGIGAGIYSGQGGFLGSTDNISISSTASSASMMLRKMGRGAKKGARSIKGLFRPKSVIGVPAADGPIQASSSAPLQPSVAQVSMVTVEAERLKVNVNADPAERHHGITGFPKLERNSVDAASGSGIPGSRGSADGSDSRRSIVGSDKERAEVLAVVKKGILKRSGTASPAGSPVIRPIDGTTPHVSDSPASSMPSTPKDNQGRNGSMNNAGNDYFSPRAASLARSTPHTPNGTNRSISFSPRIQFHDAWSSTEYDRRGEIATCNRLTPMLAQQIKEELNTFKMEMEVHELSKPHTHFF